MIYNPAVRLVDVHRRWGEARLAKWFGRYSVGQSADALNDLSALVPALEETTPSMKLAQALTDDLVERGAVILTILDVEYPSCLRGLGNDAPPLLYVMGDIERLKSRSIAIIGTRRPSAAGKAAARFVAEAAAEDDWLVVSGNAPGIDSTAHEAAVARGGSTLVFPPVPMEQYMPNFRGGRPEQVTVVTTFVPGARVEPWMFLRRNTLVAAHCYAAFVAETGTRGGTLDTVKKLGKMRRETFATVLPEEAKFVKAHQMLAAGGVTLLDVLNNDSAATRQILDAAARSLRDPVVSTPVLDDLFPEEF